ncbi:MAG: T9SS type A sorting domain-containing protein, partial [Flavobacteriales bacterium]
LLNATGAPATALTPRLEYRYSTDQVWSNNDVVIGFDTSSISSAVLSNAENISFAIPSGTGTRYILARADATSMVTESNESNNTFSLSISVAQADVTVSGVSTSNTSVFAGQTITASCIQTLVNASSLSSAVQLEFRWSMDNVLDAADALLGSYPSNLTSTLNYENEIVTFSAPQTAGTYYLLAKGDSNNNITQESNESNNISSVAITVSLQPDVITANLATNTQNPMVGQTIAISCNQQISNPGSATVNSMVEYRYSSDNIWSSNDILIGYDTSAFNPANLNFAETINFSIPSGSGNFFVLAKSDATSLINEANENNNISSVALSVAQADITVTQTSISSSYVTVGQALTISCVQSIINGSSLSVSPAVEVRWSNDQVWSPATDNLIGTGTSALTASISSETETFSTTAPNTAGTYYLIFRGDVNNIIQESNESNDAVVTVVVNNLPDLTLTSLNAGTSNPYVGQTLNLTCNQVVSNASPSTITSILQYRLSTDALWSADDVVIGYDTSYVNSTTLSQSENIAYTIPNVSGTRYILARADALSQIAESNEGNNTVAISLTISMADVAIANTGVTSATASVGQSVTINASQSMTNASSLPTLITAEARWSTDAVWSPTTDALLGSTTSNLSSIASSEAEIFNCVIPNVTAGNYYILVQADALNVVSTESNSANDLIAIPVTVVVLPDITITNLAANTVNPFVGQTISISATQLTSTTSSALSARMEYRYSTDNLWSTDDVIIGQDTSSLSSAVLSENEFISFTIPSGTGTRYILARGDAPGLISESNENNNTSTLTLTVSSADVTITQASVSVNQVTIGQVLTSQFNQTMSGASTLATTLTAELRWSTDNLWSSNDTYIGQAVSSLTTGVSSELETLTIAAPSTPGTYYLLIQGDAVNQVTESNESNNLTAIIVTVTSLPDYTITGLSSSNAMPNAGQTITISCAQNQSGGTSLLNAVRMQYRYSTDAIWSSDDIIIGSDTSSISSSTTSNSESITYTIPTGNGTRYVLAMADAFSQWNESNENNNNVSITLNVGAANLPDVTLTSIVASATAVNTGQSVTVTCNQVISAAPSTSTVSNIEYRWSADQIWATTDLLVGTSTSTFSTTALSESESITFNIPNTPGTYYLLLMADASNTIIESNENNVFSITYTVTAPTALPDIYITGAGASATTVVPGQLIDISCNQFTSLPNMALDTVFLQYRWNTLPTATGSTLFGSDWSDLGGGDASDPENQNFTIPAGTGQRYVIIICNWNSGVVESDETNNVVIIPVTVNAAMAEDPNQEAETKSITPGDIKTLALNVYPNPARDLLSVVWSNASEHEQPVLTVLDLSGRVVNAPVERRKDGVFISLESLSNGSYILMLQDQEQVAVQRFMVVK